MILESFPQAFEGRTVILLHSGTRAEVAELLAALRSLTDGSIPSVAVHRLPFVTAPLPCSLFPAISNIDEGVTADESLNSFEWRQTRTGWERVVDLLSSFVDQPGGGFHYLNEHGGPEVIYSTGRYWSCVGVSDRAPASR